MRWILISSWLLLTSASTIRAQAEDLYSIEKDVEPLKQRFQQKRAEALAPLYKIYIKELKKLEKKFTKAGKLELALAVRAEAKEAESEMLAETERDLADALLKYKWGWHPQGSGIRLQFRKDGVVWHLGMHGRWKIVGERQVLISPADGHPKVLMQFDKDLTKWSQVDGNYGGIRREPVEEKK